MADPGCRGSKVMKLDDVMDSLEDNEALLMDPQDQFNPCIVGTGYLFHHGPVAVYDIGKVIAVFVAEGMTEEEAQEYFESTSSAAGVEMERPYSCIYLHHVRRIEKKVWQT